MTTEAEQLANELTEAVECFPEPTRLESAAAALLRSQAAEIERLKLLTANEQTLHAEIERLTAENEANMQTCKGIIKGLTADRKRKDALLRECLTALEYHTDHTLDTMDKVKTELGE